ncbi:MAG: hypothetical protein AB8G16_01600 [Gammaproteobacteria bacterium]
MFLVLIGLGALAAVPFLYFVNQLRSLAVALVVVALIYVLFALFSPASAGWIIWELAGVLAFGLFALASFRFGFACLAVGWAGHVLWDVVLHQHFYQPDFVPGGYPTLCLGFDVVVAGYCLWRWRTNAPLPSH